MREKGSILKNIFTFGVSSATMGFLLLLAVVAARILGPEDFGVFSFALAFVFFFDFLLDPGLYHLVIREVARDKSKTGDYLLHMLLWKLAVIPVAFLLIAIIVNILHDDKTIHHAVYLMAVSSFIKSLKDVYRSGLLAHEKFVIEAVSSVIEKGGLLIFGSLALFLDYGLYGLCWAFVLVRAVDLAVIHFLSRHDVEFARGGVNLDMVKQLLKTGVPIGAYYVTLNLYNYIDSVMISVMRGSEEVGLYSASYKIYEGLLIIPIVIGTVMLPRLSASLGDQNRGEFNELVTQGWKYSLIVALCVTAFGVPLAYELTELFYGNQYIRSAVTLQILFFGVIVAYMVNFLQTVMISAHMQNKLVVIAMSGLVMNVAINYFAIRSHGYVGAAAVTVLVESIVFLMLGYYIVRLSAGAAFVGGLLKIIVCWVVSAAPVLLVLDDMPRYMSSGLWVAGFVLLLRAVNVVTDQEWRHIASVFQGAK